MQHLLIPQHKCYSWLKRISWHWIFFWGHFYFARRCTMKTNMENWSKKGLLYENMQWSQLISGACLGSLTSWSTEQLCLSEMNISVCSAGSVLLASGHVITDLKNGSIWIFYQPVGQEWIMLKCKHGTVANSLTFFKGKLVTEMGGKKCSSLYFINPENSPVP